MLATARSAAKIFAVLAAVPASLLIAGTTVAAASPTQAGGGGQADRPGSAPSFQVRQVLNGMKLSHSFIPAGSAKRRSEPLTGPDDITVLRHHLYTAFQNGVGSQGEPSTDGNTASTVVEFTAAGHVIRQWDIRGKCDGLTADTAARLVIATVNEDGNSSVYTIKPGAPAGSQIQHFQYSRQPLPHNGGTDAISVFHGHVLISASAPGTIGKPAPQPGYPAVYVVTFNRATHVATTVPLFSDEAAAVVANQGADRGKVVRLALTDPDSNEVVPASGPRFAGDFMLNSQGDKEQIFRRGDRLAVLRLSQSIDDTAWAQSPAGRLFGSDASSDTIDEVTGPFPPHSIFVAVTPCDAGNAPATCPAPGFPANFLGQLNPWTGQITRVPVTGPAFTPKGLLFVGPA
jgi:hypothetical protein